ncbi:MAG: hypothetical protein KGY48_07840 [Wenzhouxiangellaceae bacterium]|nr:hypothetical protein [Wenzhouxiangellaceae bacterium]MBS3746730.1 hypothetical protein [Wenzhouxiangellaceae bacterium]MBS3823646.1 hypothetical protein [Wenzhouxiangellaceae bacterium]
MPFPVDQEAHRFLLEINRFLAIPDRTEKSSSGGMDRRMPKLVSSVTIRRQRRHPGSLRWQEAMISAQVLRVLYNRRMRLRNRTVRLTPRLAAGLLVAAFAADGIAQAPEGHGDRPDPRHDSRHVEPGSVTGIVDQIQLIDASSMGGGRELILHLESGEAFRFPHADHVAASPGVKLRIRYLEASSDGDIPAACSAEVLALPLGDDPDASDDALQEASQPFEVYRNPGC